MAGTSAKTGKTTSTLRFAHPFFTPTPPDQRRAVAGAGTRMNDFIQDQLGPVPRPRDSGRLSLEDLLGSPGVAEIKAAGALR